MRNKARKAERKPRGPGRFKKTEVTRLAKAAIAAGLDVERIEVDPATGRICLIPTKPDGANNAADAS
jgi:hypothetical protein